MEKPKNRSLSPINAGSMADIAFLLLIFFLVTTTIVADTGIGRLLAPDVTDRHTDVPKRDVLEVLVNANDEIMLEGESIAIEQLREKAREFIKGYGGADTHPNFPRFKETDSPEVIKYFGEGYMVSRQVVSLQNSRETSYERYIYVQNELTAAYREVRDELSLEKFGKTYKDLTNESQIQAIKKIYPMRISEAEPY